MKKNLTPKAEYEAKQRQILYNIWPDEKTRTFTCHACKLVRIVPIEALVSRGKLVIISDEHAAPCKCGRTILELLEFEKRYCIERPEEPRPKRKRYDRRKEPVLDFSAHEPIKCFVKDGVAHAQGQ